MRPQDRSREVFSSQEGVHPRLGEVLDRHLSSRWAQPFHRPTVEAFQALQSLLEDRVDRLVLDSGCGTGDSTRELAKQLPECTVIGIDKSSARLSRTGVTSYPHREKNAVWLRAELSTFWRLAVEAGWQLERHYLLYPNPWPKPGALQRRWHAHPVFPELLKLGGRLEMRTNWEIYALEFAAAMNRALGVQVKPASPPELPVMTPFESKYRNSGHDLYSVVVSCPGGAVK